MPSKTLRCMTEVEVTLTPDQWAAVREKYKKNWATEIKAGEVEPEPGASDAWSIATDRYFEAISDGVTHEIYWDLCADAEYM